MWGLSVSTVYRGVHKQQFHHRSRKQNLETTGAPLISISEIIVELMQYIRAPLVTALDISTAFLEYKMCKHIENLLLFLVFLHTSTSQIWSFPLLAVSCSAKLKICFLVITSRLKKNHRKLSKLRWNLKLKCKSSHYFTTSSFHCDVNGGKGHLFSCATLKGYS